MREEQRIRGTRFSKICLSKYDLEHIEISMCSFAVILQKNDVNRYLSLREIIDTYISCHSERAAVGSAVEESFTYQLFVTEKILQLTSFAQDDTCGAKV